MPEDWLDEFASDYILGGLGEDVARIHDIDVDVFAGAK